MEETIDSVVRVGPAGWSYPDWKGIVYPPRMPKDLHPLSLLCKHFDTVEINSSFYRPPNPRHCESWVEKVAENPHFKFTAKLWERFSHERTTEPSQEDIEVYRAGIEPLHDAGKLGALLIQFPWSFKRTPRERLWLARVLDAFPEFPLAVELRHASWDRPPVYQSFRDRGIAFCNIDQPLFDNSLAPAAKVTAPIAYIRFHGRNREDWFREDADRNDRYNYLYSEDELRPWIDRIESIRKQAKEIYAITNNHYRGQAVVNAFEIQAMLGKRPSALPEHLVDQYPRLKRLVLGDSSTAT